MAKIVITIIIGIIISLLLMTIGEGKGLFASIAEAVGSLLLGIIMLGIIAAVWFFGGAVAVSFGIVGFGLFVCLEKDKEDGE